jgi:hypothetical protein
MRVIPLITREALERSSSGDALLIFVTVTHPDMPDVIRLVTDGADYLRDGKTWHKSWFELDLLTDDETPPQARFRFPNVDRAAITMLAAVSNPAKVSFEVISAAWFDLTVEPRVVKPAVTVEAAYDARHLFLTDITADAVQVEGTLRSWDYRQESWPDMRATEALLPGVYVR